MLVNEIILYYDAQSKKHRIKKFNSSLSLKVRQHFNKDVRITRNF